ncbi:PTS system, IIC component, putative [Streptococcus agalactiae FSL S3-026]|nr:PTS system, IIC component, putative [Streptococcus agalactiae FSL S3-026]
MQVFLNIVNKFFDPVIHMGSGVVMLIVMTGLAMIFGVKFSKALEGGIKLAIALTGIGAIIGILTGAFSESLQAFVKNTGINLSIIDVGWAPLATITWGSPYTLYFLLIMLIVNIVMIVMKKTSLSIILCKHSSKADIVNQIGFQVCPYIGQNLCGFVVLA